MAGAGAEMAGGAMTDLDRQVAMLRGWTWQVTAVDHEGTSVTHNYSPSTNLLQAFQLWDKARPEEWQLEIGQSINGSWYVVFENTLSIRDAKCKGLTDLPRAITQAWVEAREGK